MSDHAEQWSHATITTVKTVCVMYLAMVDVVAITTTSNHTKNVKVNVAVFKIHADYQPSMDVVKKILHVIIMMNREPNACHLNTAVVAATKTISIQSVTVKLSVNKVNSQMLR